MDEQNIKKLGNRIKLTLAGLFIAVAVYLIIAHRIHLLANASYIFFALFILVHLFMHRGHGGHGSHGDHKSHNDNDSQHRHDKNDGSQ